MMSAKWRLEGDWASIHSNGPCWRDALPLTGTANGTPKSVRALSRSDTAPVGHFKEKDRFPEQLEYSSENAKYWIPREGYRRFHGNIANTARRWFVQIRNPSGGGPKERPLPRCSNAYSRLYTRSNTTESASSRHSLMYVSLGTLDPRCRPLLSWPPFNHFPHHQTTERLTRSFRLISGLENAGNNRISLCEKSLSMIERSRAEPE